MLNPSDEDAPIWQIAENCSRHWDDLIQESPSEDDICRHLKQQRTRFNIWVASLGVFEAAQKSIEWRLRRNESTQSAVRQLLEAIFANLKHLKDAREDSSAAQETAQTRIPPSDKVSSLNITDASETISVTSTSNASSSASSDESESSNLNNTDLGITQRRIDDGISSLLRISTLIKQHGIAKSHAKASRYEPVDDDGNSRVSEFMSYAQVALKREIGPKRYEEDDFLPVRERLLSSVIERWRVLSYSSQQSYKVKQSFQESPMPKSVDQLIHASSSDVLGSEVPLEVPQATERNVPGPRHLPSSKGATTLSQGFTSREKELPKPTSSSYAGSSAGAKRLEFPRPPSALLTSVEESGLDEFLCPCCGIIQHFNLTSKKTWERHVMHDLAPYVCLHRACSQSHASFSESNRWMEHMMYDHAATSWRCQECGRDARSNDTSHLARFHSSQAFSDHLLYSHPGTLSDEEISLLIRLGAQRSPVVLEKCEFCGKVPQEVENIASIKSHNRDHVQQLLYRHMRNELQACALISIPWDAFEITEEDAESKIAQMTDTETHTGSRESDDSSSDLMDDDDDDGTEQEIRLKVEGAKFDIIKQNSNLIDSHSRISGWVEEGTYDEDEDPRTPGSELDDLFLWMDRELVQAFDVTNAASPNPDEMFIPISRVETYFMEDQFRRTARLLKAVFGSQSLPVSPRDVAETCCRIFCILARLGKPQQISVFARNLNLSDKRLPFNSNAPPPNFPVDTTDPDFYQRFSQEQWKFCAPELRERIGIRFEEREILPLISLERLAGGHTSTVYKALVHEKHDEIRRDTTTNHFYVIKTFRRGTAERDYERESSGIKLITAEGTRSVMPGIIAFHGSFEYRGSFNIVLEYAEGGSLEDFFLRQDRPTFGNDIIDCWQSLLEVIKGLCWIHDHRMSPHELDESASSKSFYLDLKPTNILAVAVENASAFRGVSFKIADIGQSHFKTILAEGGSTDYDTFGTRTYGSPENYRPTNYGDQRRLLNDSGVDIWSLGCIYSEAAVWIVYGVEGLRDYRRKRTEATGEIPNFRGGDSFHNGTSMLDVVDQQHRRLKMDLDSEDRITGMVLDTIVHKMLANDLGDRPTARQLEGKASDVVDRATSLWEASSYLKRSPTRALTTLEHQQSPYLQQGHNQTLIRTTEYDVPHCSISQLRDWYNKRKRGDKKAVLPFNELMSELIGRNYAFLVDDSRTMKKHWKEVQDLAPLLMYILKQADPDPIDLYFLSSPRRFSSKNSTGLGEDIRKWNPAAVTDLDSRLTDLVTSYARDIERWSAPAPALQLIKRRRPRKLSIYVFTDGILEGGRSTQGHGAIRKIFEAMSRKGMPRGQFGIQFISFGNDPEGLARLYRLDLLSQTKALPLNIVDTEPASGNVWKMLLGAINEAFDDEPAQLFESPVATPGGSPSLNPTH